MASTERKPILVVVQLTGGSDYMSMVVPCGDPLYYDNRPTVGIPVEDVLAIDGRFGFNPVMGAVKDLYDKGEVAFINGVGYPQSQPVPLPGHGHLAHLRTGKDRHGRLAGPGDPRHRPQGENVLTGVNFGRGLPRAMALTGVPVASVASLDNYGVLNAIQDQEQRARALDLFARMYSPAIGTGAAMDYLGRTGRDALRGADILRTATESYTSSVEYAATPFAQSLRRISQVLLKDLGARVFYTSQGGYDTHANQIPVQTPLLSDLSAGIGDFFADLKEHDAADNVLMLVFTEFGRRVKDNGSGSDHGSGGASLHHRPAGKRRHAWTVPVPEAGGPTGRRPPISGGFPQRLCHHRREMAGSGRQISDRRPLPTNELRLNAIQIILIIRY